MADEDYERKDFPILCNDCLGDNPFIRMLKAPMDKECKLCARPMTVYRWRGTHGPMKKTEICQTCAKLKNACQSCILDLEFGLPTHIRDQGLALSESVTQVSSNSANRDWQQKMAEKEFAEGRSPFGREGIATVVSNLARAAPVTAQTGGANTCAFWLRGQCTRGTACPHLHVLPGALEAYGGGGRAAGSALRAPPKVPDDDTIKTVFVGNVNPQVVTEIALKEKFSTHGKVESVRLVPRKKCAFVEFAERSDAEKAVNALYADCLVNNVPVSISWSKSSKGGSGKAAAATNIVRMAPQPAAAPLPQNVPLPGSAPVTFPSMDPNQRGTKRKAGDH